MHSQYSAANSRFHQPIQWLRNEEAIRIIALGWIERCQGQDMQRLVSRSRLTETLRWLCAQAGPASKRRQPKTSQQNRRGEIAVMLVTNAELVRREAVKKLSRSHARRLPFPRCRAVLARNQSCTSSRVIARAPGRKRDPTRRQVPRSGGVGCRPCGRPREP